MRVRVLGAFCAAPGLDVAKGALLDVEPWVAQAWSASGHVALEEERAEPIGAEVPSGFVIDTRNADIRVAEPAPEGVELLRGPGDGDGTGGVNAGEAVAGEPAPAVPEQEQVAAAPAESEASVASDEGPVPAQADEAQQHPEAGVPEAVTSRAPRSRNRDPRR